jgi:hypothetical protein
LRIVAAIPELIGEKSRSHGNEDFNL